MAVCFPHPSKILYPFPKSQSVVCWGVWVCVCCGLKEMHNMRFVN